jgi:hypothetical protein
VLYLVHCVLRRCWNRIDEARLRRVASGGAISILLSCVWGCFGRDHPSAMSLCLWSCLFGIAFSVFCELDKDNVSTGDVREEEVIRSVNSVSTRCGRRRARVLQMPKR